MEFAESRKHCNILELFQYCKQQEPGFLRVSAPMVRYSKLEFRHLLRKHGVQLCFTPMIVADSFIKSEKARQNEFTTAENDQPIVAQFAAKDAREFQYATQLIYPYVDGVDLNCGCPQSWAITKGYGCALLKNPEHVKDIVQSIKRLVPNDFSISMKIRLLNNENDQAKSTVDFIRQIENCGVTFITLHGRTLWQKSSESINIAAVKDVKNAIKIPLIANGDVRTWADACYLHSETQADGIMSARGLLSNPNLFNPLFRNLSNTSIECLKDWLAMGRQAKEHLNFTCFHHHLIFMWSSQLQRTKRSEFNSFTKKQQIFEFFKSNYQIENILEQRKPFIYQKCNYEHFMFDREQNSESKQIAYAKSEGKYFLEFSEQMNNVNNDSIHENDIKRLFNINI